MNKLVFPVLLATIFFSCSSNSSNQQSSDSKMKEEKIDSTENYSYFFGGTYTRKESFVDGRAKGIHLLGISKLNNEVTKIKTFAGNGIVNPSFLSINDKKNILYAVKETPKNDSIPPSVHAFKYDLDKKSLNLISGAKTIGGSPCHISYSSKFQLLFVANYGPATLDMYMIKSDGGVGQLLQSVAIEGSGPNKSRQESAHGHQVVPDEKNNRIFIVDLGGDQVLSYKVIIEEVPYLEKESVYASSPGNGPRHMVIHPSKPFVYILNELNSTIDFCRYDMENGSLEFVQNVNMLPEEFKGTNLAAEIQIHPNGKMLYASNRGHDSIVQFTISDGGQLELDKHISAEGKAPRFFTISNDTSSLIIANQDSNNLVVYTLDENGTIGEKKSSVDLLTTVCLVEIN